MRPWQGWGLFGFGVWGLWSEIFQIAMTTVIVIAWGVFGFDIDGLCFF